MKFFLLFLFTISTAITQKEFEQSVKQFFIEDKPLFDQAYGFKNIKLILEEHRTGEIANLINNELIIGRNHKSFFEPWLAYKTFIPSEEYFYLADPDVEIRKNLKTYLPIAKQASDYLFKHGFLNTIEEEND